MVRSRACAASRTMWPVPVLAEKEHMRLPWPQAGEAQRVRAYAADQPRRSCHGSFARAPSEVISDRSPAASAILGEQIVGGFGAGAACGVVREIGRLRRGPAV